MTRDVPPLGLRKKGRCQMSNSKVTSIDATEPITWCPRFHRAVSELLNH